MQVWCHQEGWWTLGDQKEVALLYPCQHYSQTDECRDTSTTGSWCFMRGGMFVGMGSLVPFFSREEVSRSMSQRGCTVRGFCGILKKILENCYQNITFQYSIFQAFIINKVAIFLSNVSVYIAQITFF